MNINIRFFIVILAAPVCLFAGEPAETNGRITRQSLALVKKAHPYEPIVFQEDVESITSDVEVVQMDPFVVDSSRLLRSISAAMDRQAAKLKAEKFTLTKGGLFFKNERLDLGITKYENPIKDPSASTHPVPTPEFNLLRFKF